jgi:hypothetical protein
MSQQLPAPVDQVLYMFYFPPTSVIAEPDGQSLCDQFAGYHNGTFINGKRVAYAVIGDCRTGPDDVTNTASHELIEAATDPYPDQSAGWFLDPDPGDPWSVESGQEIADMCEDGSSWHENGIALARGWSNAAAMAQKDPCQPSDDMAYASVRVTPDGVPEIAAGATMQFILTGWSFGNAQPWHIDVADSAVSVFSLTEQAPSLSSHNIFNHGSVTLSITAPASGQYGDLGGLIVVSGTEKHRWPVAYTIK